MKEISLSIVIILFCLVACGAQPSPVPVAKQPTDSQPPPATAAPSDTPLSLATAPPTETPSPATEPPTKEPTEAPAPTIEPPAPTEAVAAADYAGLDLPTERGEFFSASGACTICHTQMVDDAGADVSTDRLWRASMMANSARDPYWRATVRAETLSNPQYQAVIEDKCATCHMPMARFTETQQDRGGKVLDDGLVAPDHQLHVLAVDGISCTLCHQLRSDGFGMHESYSGSYAIDTEKPSGERVAYGPHPVGRRWAETMLSGSGFWPVQSMHIEESALCATCHVLYTPYVGSDGEIAGEFPEQTVYLEWLASYFGGTVSCQGCHMPPAKGSVRLSLTGGPERQPFHRHIFAGGNAYMLGILSAFGEEMEVTASSAQLQEKQGEVIQQLQERSASIALKETSLEGSSLTAQVVVANMVGHKFPAGFPSRRVWIHFVVRDVNDQVIFESGGLQSDGSITGNDNDSAPGSYEVHYDTIDSPDQVQIYEAIMADTEGEVTTTLLRSAEYLKDNRLLPAGFDKSVVETDIAVYGGAASDVTFGGSGDEVRYVVDLDAAQGPFAVTAELLYQSIGYRWAENLRRYDAPEAVQFSNYYDRVPNEPVVVDTAQGQVGE
jgi:hypothetical protein